ncbi:dead end protein homolog 1-like isoform X2 [Leucoraja erinacea]|uniref:dead end protein homolog 1-like isoform X2 n=1 Tax=Leucoraja erinaceus TaxID=7782 RepID=UPI002453F609|nr:dead end protein homolog 1-like isoform X2 [Leucoraja erinacea]
MASMLLNSANKLAFDAWVEETGIDLVQVNGQRKFGGPPPGWMGNPPLTGSEVFVGKLPQDVYEDKLIPLFQAAGKLYEFRLMMTFSGENRGFAYAKYANRWYAQCAIAMFNGYQIRDGCPILVCRSTEKNELCVAGIPWGRGRAEVMDVVKELTDGVSDLSLHLSADRRKKMTMFAVVKYESHRAAAMAKKKLVEDCIELWGQPIEVDWMKPDGRQKGQQMLLSETQPSLQVSAWPVMTRGLCLPPIKSATCAAPTARFAGRSGFSPSGERGEKIQRPFPEVPCPLNVACDVVRLLDAYCLKKRLGKPVYSVQSLRSNQHRFLFKVFLPGLTAHFSGMVTLTPEDLASGRDVPKEEAARQVLMYLGHSMGFEGFHPHSASVAENQT